MPLKRLGNLREDEGNKHIPRSGFEGRNSLIRAEIQDSTIGCKSSRGTLLRLSYIAQKCFSLTCVWKGISIPFIYISIIKRILSFFKRSNSKVSLSVLELRLEHWFCLQRDSLVQQPVHAVLCAGLGTTNGLQRTEFSCCWSTAEVRSLSASVLLEVEKIRNYSALVPQFT